MRIYIFLFLCGIIHIFFIGCGGQGGSHGEQSPPYQDQSQKQDVMNRLKTISDELNQIEEEIQAVKIRAEMSHD